MDPHLITCRILLPPLRSLSLGLKCDDLVEGHLKLSFVPRAVRMLCTSEEETAASQRRRLDHTYHTLIALTSRSNNKKG